MTIHELEAIIKKFDLYKAVESAINNTSEQLEEAQAAQQYSGIKEDGTEITPDYALSTINVKRTEGKIFSHVTLRDIGAFHRNMAIYASNFIVYFTSSVSYTKDLEQKYTEGIWGFAPRNTERVKEILMPYVRSYYEFDNR